MSSAQIAEEDQERGGLTGQLMSPGIEHFSRHMPLTDYPRYDASNRETLPERPSSNAPCRNSTPGDNNVGIHMLESQVRQ